MFTTLLFEILQSISFQDDLTSLLSLFSSTTLSFRSALVGWTNEISNTLTTLSPKT